MKSGIIKKIVAFLLCGLMMLSVMSTMFYVSAAEESDVDLAVTSVMSSSSNVYDSDKISLSATVRNMGTTAIEQIVPVSFYVDGKLLQTVKYSEKIEAGTMKTVTTLAYKQMGFGTHRLTAEINSTASFVEADYSNNSVKKRISVIDDVNPNPAPDPLPVELDMIDKNDPYIIEVEDCPLSNGAVESTENKGYKGSGYVTGFSTPGAAITIQYDAPKAGNYEVTFRYSTAIADRQTIAYSVNASTNSYVTRNFDGQERTDSWGKKSTTINFKEGKNTLIVFSPPSGDADMYIDRLEIVQKTTKKVTEFGFLKKNNPSLDDDIWCKISDGKITATVSHDTDLTDLVATYTTASESVTVQGVEQENGVTHNNFVNGHYYTFTDSQGSMTYSVYLDKLKDNALPELYVNLDDTVTQEEKKNLESGWDKEIKSDCKVTLTVDDQTEVFGLEKGTKLATLNSAAATINIRGNSTLMFPKRPFKIKLSKKAAILDMPAQKHWVLLAAYEDKSFMRYYMGFELARVCNNMEWASHFRFVNLYLEGHYNGVYLLGEQIKIDEGRVDITEIESSGATDITGGYLVEVDHRKDDFAELLFEVEVKGWTIPFTIKQPDEEIITDEMREYIQGYIQEFIDSIKYDSTTHEYENYIEVDTFIDWYITMEVMRPIDATGYASVYMYKDAGGKLCMGPVWDFSPGGGNADYSDPVGFDAYEGLYISSSLWWRYLFRDEKFADAVKSRWQELYATGFDGFLDEIYELEEYLQTPAEDNFTRWDCLDTYVWAQPEVLHSYEAEVDMFKRWIKLRIEWLNEQYGA